MMNNLKFRAWHKEYKLMGQVITICFDGVPTNITRVNILTKNGVVNILKKELSDIELMQFSGLQDIKDQDVYEGDILEFWLDLISPTHLNVQFFEGQFVVAAIDDVEKLHIKGLWEFLGESTGIRQGVIIGNIYEHPHLLDKQYDK